MIKKNRVIDCVPRVRAFLRRASLDNMTAFAAQSAFFALLALVPFFMLILSAASLGFPPDAAEELKRLLPSPLASLLPSLTSGGGVLTPVSALTALWASSRGVSSVIRGLNVVERVTETRHYFRLRLAAAAYTFVFLLLVLLALLLLLFGGGADALLKRLFPGARWLVLIDLRSVLAIFLLTGLFLLIYRYLPAGKAAVSFRDCLPGAFLTAVAWPFLSSFFSFYALRMADYSRLYGSLAAVVMVMLWLYACMTCLFLGAELNVALRGDGK